MYSYSFAGTIVVLKHVLVPARMWLPRLVAACYFWGVYLGFKQYNYPLNIDSQLASEFIVTELVELCSLLGWKNLISNALKGVENKASHPARKKTCFGSLPYVSFQLASQWFAYSAFIIGDHQSTFLK